MSKTDLNALNKRESKSSIIKRLLKEVNAPSNESITVAEALEFRREQYGLTRTEFATILGLARSHYNEIINGKRLLSFKPTKRAFAIGVPAKVLLQIS